MTRLEDCNCDKKMYVWRGGCRTKNIVYEATSKECSKFYIGNNQCKAKIQFNQYYASVSKTLEKGISSSIFAKHQSKCYIKRYKTKKYDINKVQDIIEYEILYERNPLKMVKTYRSNKCILCMEERDQKYLRNRAEIKGK